jgi:glycosyltransferase involved in cell wall biosynthesis
MDIGIFGLWGMNIPGVSFGGFAHGFTEIAWRLAEQGHQVTIYCRRKNYPLEFRLDTYKNVNLVYIPTIDTKNLSFVTAVTTSLFYALLMAKHDIYMFANVGSGIHCLIARLLGKKVILNVDGLDWVRGKWNRLASLYFQLGARTGLFACDALITDADAMVDFYVQNYDRKLEMIAYGADIEDSEEPTLIAQFGVSPRQYYLIASRLVPENHADLIIDAYKKLDTDRILLIVGDTNYESPFHQRIRNSGDHRVQFTGWIDDQRVIKELHCNCYAYLHGHSVGGTNPALLKALGYSNLILALNTPFNSEVLKRDEFGILFEKDVEDLKGKLEYVEKNSLEVDFYRQKAPQRIQQNYTWERITDQYLNLFTQVIGGRSDSRIRMRNLRLGLLIGLISIISLLIFLLK